MIVAGTRPEATKLAPVILAARRRESAIHVSLVATGQHREMTREALGVFGLVPDIDLDIMQERQSLADVMCRSLTGLDSVIRECRPDAVLVQGDTLAVAAGALAAFFHRVPAVHVEAGLRTGNVHDPFPEEMNRRLAGQLCSVHCAPTRQSRDHLLREGIRPEAIYITGNTVTDAIQWAAERMREPEAVRVAPLGSTERVAFASLGLPDRYVVVTAHRRENIPERLTRICAALAELAKRDSLGIVFAVHPNPAVREIVQPMLGSVPSVALIEPPDYLTFAGLMSRCAFLITDSGGVQEEAPALRRPVLVVRETTERPEGVAAGVAQLVGTRTDDIVRAAARLLDDPVAYAEMQSHGSPYGDGACADRVLDATLHHLGLGPRPEDYAPAT